MIPYFEQPSFSIGPITIYAFGVIVAVAVLVGLRIGATRFAELGLDRAIGERMAWWAIVGGFVGAHLFAVLLYFPREVAANPLILFKLWDDIASFGSILGGFLGIWLFFLFQGRTIDSRARWMYVDVAAFVFPVSLMIGRIGCALAHDHPGTITRFPLAVSLSRPEAQSYIAQMYAGAGRTAELPPSAALAQLGFHDLGWYEFLYLAAVVVPAILLLRRQLGARARARPGAFLLAFVLLYMPVRFFLDFLRVSDARYGGLTPAQWSAAVLLLVVPLIVARARARAISLSMVVGLLAATCTYMG